MATEAINRQLALTASPDEALVLIAEAAAELLGAAAVGVRLREGCELVRAVALGKAAAIMVAERLSIATGLAGQVVRENRAIVSLDLISTLGEDPVHQERVRAEGLGSWIGVPLPGPNQASGVLFAADAPERRFDRGDLEALQALASQAALALKLSGLQRDRTSQETRLNELASQLLQSQERERRRLAYDLHDGVAQLAVAVQQHVEMLAFRWRPRSPEARTELELARQRSRNMVQDTRQVIAGLRASVLANQGLADTIRLELEGLISAGWDVEFEEQLGGERLPEAVETALFRVAQEALTNARKHAQTNRLRVSLRRDARVICLEVRDWGRGFALAEMCSSSGPHERIGLAGIRERIGWLQGRCTVRSEPGKGTLIVVEVPLPGSTRTGDHTGA